MNISNLLDKLSACVRLDTHASSYALAAHFNGIKAEFDRDMAERIIRRALEGSKADDLDGFAEWSKSYYDGRDQTFDSDRAAFLAGLAAERQMLLEEVCD